MNDRQRLEAIISVVCKYLPPDGTPIKEAMSEIISLVDPLPPLPVQPERTWVGLTGQEKALIASVSLDVHDAIHRAEAKLKEKNT